MPAEPHHAVVRYPGGLRASFRWAGSGGGPTVFALTETGGVLSDLGDRVAPDPERLCRAELRVEGPAGPWTVRLASTIYDEPAGLLWDATGQLVIKFGFHAYGLDSRTGALRWLHRSGTPILGVLGSSRLAHVLVAAEIETFAVEADGTVAWRVAHSDVVDRAELVGGRLVLTGYAGGLLALDPATGRTIA